MCLNGCRVTVDQAEREKTVLLAEDEPMVRALVRSVLINDGYTVLEAVDGSQALQLSREFAGHIDLLLTDIRMPHMTGTELARRIHLERPSTTILTMSAYSSGEFERLSSPAHFIRKPFMARGLSKKIREVMQEPTSES